MRCYTARLIASLVLFQASVPSEGLAQSAQTGTPVPSLTVGRTLEGEAPVVDGRVDEAAWQRAEPFGAFVQQEPNEGEPATERTEIRFLLDRQTLYIAVVCFDSEPDKILVSQSRRDAPLNETDSVQILLDTFNDGQNAFVFGTNPFGI
ncbi:MAG: carbohydrate binding family 9 domain-containing protein, partial [Acidobacteria bacterium]|nr:carbohydrate binding family 9 domain-containing protein [Acidobacteriota bacterium]